MATRKSSSKRTPVAALGGIPRFKPFPALMTEEQRLEGERVSEEQAAVRRIAMIVLTRNSVELIGSMERGTMLEMAETISGHLEWRKNETELLGAAMTRLLMVLQNDLDSSSAPNSKSAAAEANHG